ncbi:MAG TPA: polyprenyl synthetase family protein [Rubricoccaceae bacterium]|nr:polyprenyl synthetase family protein [Rubricoccaceae bacterium]
MSLSAAEPVKGEGDQAEAHVRALVGQVEAGLVALALPDAPEPLYAPVRYVLESGGKRLRPVLLLLGAEAYGGESALKRAMPAALAVEVFHAFTLVHDDIMDHAAERRGRPTVHVRWDEPTAILVGDLLMALAYDLLAKVETDHLREVLRSFHQMVLRLCEGQALDKAFEQRTDVSVPDYLDMIERKTGALVEAALEIGGWVGGADAAGRAALRRFGQALGRAFQIQDDLLDLTAEDAGWGKTVGGDLVEGKKTFLLLRALERSAGEEHTWFARIPSAGGLPAEEVPEARVRMEGLGVLAEARDTVRAQSNEALAALAVLPPSSAREALGWLTRQLVGRAR